MGRLFRTQWRSSFVVKCVLSARNHLR
jgi:hypothetical protein